MLHVALFCTPCCMLLGVCCAKFDTGQTFELTTPNISFVPLSPKRSPQCWIRPVCTALPSLLGPRKRITHGLQSRMGCILPMMHCRFQHCWELLHPFAHHCQHGCHNFLHCWPNKVGSSRVRLHVASCS